MSGNPNTNSNLMDEFEEAFQNCLLSLTKLDTNTDPTKEEIEFEAQRTINRFIDVARQMEAFFLQKRFLVSTLKPEQLLKDENQDLRIEIQRKEALLNKHYSRLEEWKACLADIQQNPTGLNRPMGGVGVGMPINEIISGIHHPAGMGSHLSMQANTSGMNPLVISGQRSGLMPNIPGGISLLTQMPPGAQQHLQNQKMLQAQQMQQLRLMGKLPKQ